MTYHRTIPVEFNHCDPAGIVFYPRYFEMTNSVVENFFADRIGHSFARMMQDGNGVPTARIETEFRAPSRLGDRLEFDLEVRRLGGASVTLGLSARGGAELRLTAELTLVWVAQGRPEPWPDTIRSRLEACRKATA
jgi:4-hydroxybenzoyl-CoA thioesterase